MQWIWIIFIIVKILFEIFLYFINRQGGRSVCRYAITLTTA